MTTYIAIFLVAFVVTSAITPPVSRLAIRWGAIDVPGGRKVHERITPRLGGLAVVGGFLVGLGGGVLTSGVVARTAPETFLGVLAGAAVIVVLGIYDDIHGASAFTKFPFQILAALIAYHYGVRFTLLTNALAVFGVGGATPWVLPEAVALVMTVLWIVGVTNAMNFIDGLDALASGLAFIISTSLLVVAIQLDQPFYAAVYAALMGAVFGFGRYNKYPASIFLGDTGSTFLGFVLACTSTLANHKVTAMGSILIPVVALGVPIADTFYAIIRRLVGGKSLFDADRGHIHHRLLELGYTPREAVWLIYLLSIVLSVVVFLLVDAQNDFAALVILLLTAGSFTIARKLELLHADRIAAASAPPPRPEGREPAAEESAEDGAELEGVDDGPAPPAGP